MIEPHSKISQKTVVWRNSRATIHAIGGGVGDRSGKRSTASRNGRRTGLHPSIAAPRRSPIQNTTDRSVWGENYFFEATRDLLNKRICPISS